jgi:catechol 2,3-dioxygenase-like lactoylglutathione lyase family enzyme
VGIRRAMPLVRTDDLEASRAFYVDFLGFEPAMDEEGFLMLRSPTTPTTQVLVATDAAHDRAVLQVDMSVEVDDVEGAYADAQRRGLEIVYPLTDEPWGIRRFFVRDPAGTVVNVASHRG